MASLGKRDPIDSRDIDAIEQITAIWKRRDWDTKNVRKVAAKWRGKIMDRKAVTGKPAPKRAGRLAGNPFNGPKQMMKRR